MTEFQKLLSYIFHPIFIPLKGATAYCYITPTYIPEATIKALLLSLLILSILIPLVFFFLLKNLGIIKSIFLREVSERKIPILMNIVLMAIIVYRVTPSNFSATLNAFFLGIIGTMVIAYVLVLFKIKASMHMMGMTGVLMFLIILSLYYEVNITLIIAFWVLCSGAVASARLYLNAHTRKEIWIGSLTGFLPQLAAYLILFL